MTLYTSVTTAQLKAGYRYLAAAILVAAAGWVYESFSHGVYSDHMIYAFMIPLIAGALPNITAAVISSRSAGGDRSRLNSGDGIIRPNIGDRSRTRRELRDNNRRKVRAGLQLAAVVTLTAGSLISGALEIYGTTNRLTVVYPILGTALLAAWLMTGLRKSGSKQ